MMFNKINYSKSKEEMYQMVRTAFEDLKRVYNFDFDIDFDNYFNLRFIVVYKNGAMIDCSWMDIQDRDICLTYNYFNSHSIEDVISIIWINPRTSDDDIYVYSDNNMFINSFEDNSISYTEIFDWLYEKYENIILLDMEGEKYDTYSLRRYDIEEFI